MQISKSVFLIEDDQDDQFFFKECLGEIKNATLYGVANNGREALDKLKSSRKLPDIIFMDIHMPYMNGLECLTEINKSSQLKTIPVVMLSSDVGQAQLTGILGAKAFIKKSADCETLHTKVEQMINLDFITDGQIAAQTFYSAASAF